MDFEGGPPPSPSEETSFRDVPFVEMPRLFSFHFLTNDDSYTYFIEIKTISKFKWFLSCRIELLYFKMNQF